MQGSRTRAPGAPRDARPCARFSRKAVALATSAAVLAATAPVQAAAPDYDLMYIELIAVKDALADTVGTTPGGIVPSYSSDGQWIYYHGPCGEYQGGDAYGGCPEDSGGMPDYVYHTRRLKVDQTDDECITCGATGSSGTNSQWLRHTGVPEAMVLPVPNTNPVQYDTWMLFTRASVLEAPPASRQLTDCGGGIYAPGGGFTHHLYVRNIDTGAEYGPLDSDNNGALYGVLDPRWSDDGQYVLWSEIEALPDLNSPEKRLGDWRLRAGVFSQGDLLNNQPHLHGFSTHGTLATIDPNPDGTRIPGGFLRPSVGSGVTAVYYGGSTKVISGQHQHTYHDDLGVISLSDLSLYDLTNTSGLTPPGQSQEPAAYEEHAHLNQRYWDAYLWMTSDGTGGLTPPTTSLCFINDLATDLWMMNQDGSGKRRISFYNDSGTSWVGSGLNPNNYPTVVSKLGWAPNGVDAVVSVAMRSEEEVMNEDNDEVLVPAVWENQLAIYHFKRWQIHTQTAAIQFGGFSSPANVAADDDTYATAGIGAVQEFSAFDFQLPAPYPSARTADVEVVTNWKVSSSTNSPQLLVRVGWPSGGGVAWSDWKATATGGTSEIESKLVGPWKVSNVTHTFTQAELGGIKVQVGTYCALTGCAVSLPTFSIDRVVARPSF